MKALLLSALTLAGLPLFAQTSTTTTSTTSTATATTPPPVQQPAAAPSPNARMAQVMSVLTPAEQGQLKAAQQKAVIDNPNLQTEAMDLAQKNMALQSGTGTDADKLAFEKEAQAYAGKVRAAMIKADPTVEPLIKKVEDELHKLRAEAGAAH